MIDSTSSEPALVASDIRARVAASSLAVSVFWVTAQEDRETYAVELAAELERDMVAVVVVRGARFDNPNCVLDDFVDLIRRRRAECEAGFATAEPYSRCGVVLVARAELVVAQAASPVLLPEWFPVDGGRTVTARIEDLTWSAEASLNASVARVDDLCALIFEVEGLALGHVSREFKADHNRTQRLFAQIKRDGEAMSDFLESAHAARSRVHNPSGYRPSIRSAASLTARLWSLTLSQKPDGLSPTIKGLKEALGVPDDVPTWHETAIAVIGRPATRDADEGLRFTRSLIATISASCQYATAAAHADSYRPYPIQLLRSLSYDLRRGLSSAVSVLETC